MLDQVNYLFEDLTQPHGWRRTARSTRHARRDSRTGRSVLRGRRRVLSTSPLALARVRSGDPDRMRPLPERPLVRDDHGTVGPHPGPGALRRPGPLLRRMWAGKLSEEEGARQTVALTVTFDDEGRHRPSPTSKRSSDTAGRSPRRRRIPRLSSQGAGAHDASAACPGRSTSWTPASASLPDFVARRRPDDPTRELVPVTGAGLAGGTRAVLD